MWLLLLRWFSGCVAAAVAFAAHHLHCPKEVFIVDRFSICPRLPVNIIRQPQDLLARPGGAQDHLPNLWWQQGKDQGKIKLWSQTRPSLHALILIGIIFVWRALLSEVHFLAPVLVWAQRFCPTQLLWLQPSPRGFAAAPRLGWHLGGCRTDWDTFTAHGLF